ncbi:uncharacterized protein BCR38DRAFT_487913 [Pseudomassariella vexata]|uniref:Uncharacterized protein n=1 Tax=Pseudomassariella vexata TaxID=1141098 RepID=A0A1Y2DNI4_9PEZI|nr:uncharacterized protein BCR38DRAFT_487913 [Pseudomassariella vexata]ORY60853.1 hypothetical protein BCR38DRAFT_487913 [Pseudomassariella vexata]
MFSLPLGVIAVIRVWKVQAEEYKPHRALQKLFAFKVIVRLTFLLQVASNDDSEQSRFSCHGGLLGIKPWNSLMNPKEFISVIMFVFNMESEAYQASFGQQTGQGG